MNIQLIGVDHDWLFLEPARFPMIVGTHDFEVKRSSPIKIRKWAFRIRQHPKVWAKQGISLQPAGEVRP